MSHAAVLARELGLTAVIGVPGLLDRVHDGDQVELDPVAGTITVIGCPPTTQGRPRRRWRCRRPSRPRRASCGWSGSGRVVRAPPFGRVPRKAIAPGTSWRT